MPHEARKAEYRRDNAQNPMVMRQYSMLVSIADFPFPHCWHQPMRFLLPLLALTLTASAQLTWSLASGNASWPADKRAAIIAAMDEAVAIYNANGYFPKTLWANYNASVPTAQASYSGWIDFGGQIGTRTALHEISHTLGVGQFSTWTTNQSGGKWTGTFANNRVKLFDGPSATIGCDTIHFWPYGLNFANEDSTLNRVRHVKMVSAFRRDMGIVTDSDGDGIPNDWEMFYFGNLSQTAAGDADGDGVNNLAEYQADTNPAAAATQWTGAISSDWTTLANWNPAIAQTQGTFYTRINVNNNGNSPLVYDAARGTTILRPADRGLVIGSGSNNANTSGTMHITGGSFSTVGAQSPDVIGNGQGNSGVLNITGGSFASDELHLGVSGQGAGNLDIQSGSADIAALSFRFASGGTGTVHLNGGSLTTTSISRSGSGIGNLNLNGGILRAGGSSENFVEGLSNAFIRSNGVTLDSSTHSVAIAQALLNDPAFPNGGIVKTGSGIVTLTGNNTYTGATQIHAGTLAISHANALGAATAGTSVANSATLALADNITTPVAESVSIAGVGKDSRGALQSQSGSNVWSGPVTVTASNTRIGVQDGASLTVSGNITEASPGTTVIFRAGLNAGNDITLTGTGNTWTGPTHVFSSSATGGALRLGASDTLPASALLQVAGPGVAGRLDLNGFDQTSSGLTHSTSGSSAIGTGIVTNSGATVSTLTLDLPQSITREFIGVIENGIGGVQLIKSGPGTQILSGPNTYTSGTRIAAGTLRQGVANAFGSTSSNLDLTGGAANLNGMPLGIGQLNGTGGSIHNNASSTEALLTLGNGNASGGIYSGTIADRSTGTGTLGLTKTGSGVQTLAGNNSFSGPLQVNAGVLVAASASALGSSQGACNIESGGSLRMADGISITGKSITLQGTGAGFNGALQAAENASAIWAGPIILADAAARIGAMPGGTLVISGPVSGNAGFQSLSIGAGTGGSATVILSAPQGTNTYQGTTSIIRGTLKLGAHHSLPATTTLDVDSANAAEAAIFDLNGYDQSVASLQRTNAQGGAGASIVTNSQPTHSAFTIHSSDDNTFSGSISGNLSVIKSGNGSLTLSGANTYQGNTTVAGGTLQLDSPSLADASHLSIHAGARLTLNHLSNDQVIALTLGDLPMPPGTYGGTSHPAYFAGSGMINVPLNFSNWLHLFPQFSAEESTPLGDPDLDGIPNLVEYVLGTSPELPTATPLETRGEQNILYLNFDRLPARTDLIITVEASDSLSDWTPIARSLSGSPFTALAEHITCSEMISDTSRARVTIRDATPSAQKRFLRISVSQ